MEALYDYQVEAGQLVSPEMVDILVSLTDKLNYEVAVYLNRKGQVEGVALGDQAKVSLPELSRRRGLKRLSKLRLIHTHPGGSGHLSSVDVAALNLMRFDCMVAIGVKEGRCRDLWVGFIHPEASGEDCLQLGPFTVHQAMAFPFMDYVEEVEKALAKEDGPEEEEGPEKAIVVGVELRKQPWGELGAKESLAELKELAEAAGAIVLREFLQKRERQDQALYIGKGLAEELALLIQAQGIKLVVMDTELSGTQLRNLERILGCKVLDRTGLILDIFAQRARSREGKIQVELAQLEYLLPRLVGHGTEMSRLAGGIGTRGPGETKLEQDRRHIQKRIVDLKKQLAQVGKQRKVTKGKRDFPLVTLVGYTNAGKSTLRYKLLEIAGPEKVDWAQEDSGTDQLFATLDSTVRSILLPNGQKILIADTVGFIQKLPHQLVSAFKATLEEVQEADVLLHVVDASNQHFEEQIKAVEKVLRELKVLDKPAIIVLNKIDLLPEGIPLFNHPYHQTVGVSAKTGAGIRDLLEALAALAGSTNREVELLLPHEEGQLLGRIFEEGQVQTVDYRDDGVFLKAVVPEFLYGQVSVYKL